MSGPTYPIRTPAGSRGADASLPDWVRAASGATDAIATARGIADAAPGLLRAFAEALDCEARLWVPSADDTLHCLRSWVRSGEGRAGAEAAAPSPVRMGVGLTGRAWSLRRPVWGPVGAPGPHGAEDAGVAIPFVYGDAVHGVLELLRHGGFHPAEEHDLVAAQVGKQIGQFAAREGAYRDLIRSRRVLGDLFENAPVGMHLLDREGRILRANRAELEMLGYAREEYVGRLWREFHVDPFAADDLLAWLAGGDPGEQVMNFDARLRCKDGTERWVRINANVLFDEGEFVHLRGFTRDVTAGKEAESALRASEERLRRMIDGARDYAIHTLDARGRIASWNAAAERLYGYAAPEIVGEDCARTYPEEERAEGLPGRLVALALDEGEYRHEGWQVRRDGTRFWAEVVYSALHAPDGTLTDVSQLTRDLTLRRWLDDLRRKSNELQASNRNVLDSRERSVALLQRLQAAVEGSVASIEASALALRDRPGSKEVEREAEAIVQGVRALRSALDEMDPDVVAQPPEGEAPQERMDLVHLAHEARDMLRDAASARRVRVEVDVDPSLTDVVGEADRLRQVLYNFLSNAVKFSRERGRVSVRIGPAGSGEYRVEVEDYGIGIPPVELQTIFHVRGRSADGGPDPVGLAATRHIVEGAGGRVGVHSSPGRGSLFFAVLPRRPLPRRTEAPGAVAVDAAPVLVVSEEPATRAALTWTLVHAGFEVRQVQDEDEALRAFSEAEFSAVAVDLLLGRTSPAQLVAGLSGLGEPGAPGVVAAIGGAEGGVAGLVVRNVVRWPVSAHEVFAALERCRVPRTKASPILLVDGDVAQLRSATRSLEAFGYRVVGEPDADRALSLVGDDPPSAILLGLFPLGLDVFTFLLHLRRLGAEGRRIPVFLLLPDHLSDSDVGRLRAAAGGVARDVSWTRHIRGEA